MKKYICPSIEIVDCQDIVRTSGVPDKLVEYDTKFFIDEFFITN